MKWIRWPGLIAFVALFGSLFVFAYFFAGSFVKGAIEEYGSEALGAQVNVDSVKLTIDPLGFRVGRIQAANPDEPMTNAVETKSIAFELAFWNLFMGQVIINELSVDELQFNTPRESSGALKKKTAEEIAESQEPSVLDDVKQELPSTDEILARETLLTEVRGEELKVLYEQRSKEIDEVQASLATQKQLKAYEAEIKQLTSGKLKSLQDFQQRKGRLSQINKELKAEKEKISQAKKLYSSSYKELSAKLKEVKAAPSQDLKNLKSKYSLDEGGAVNVTKLLFGNEAGGWTETTLEWYEKAKPYLESAEEEEVQKVERKKGRYVHFGGIESLPEFLLREGRIDVKLPAGHLGGQLRDFTHQPEILRRPAKLSLNGNELKGYDSISLDAVFNHIDPKNSIDRADFTVKAMEVSDFTVSGDSSFKLSLSEAKTDIVGTAIIKNGKLDLSVDTSFTEAQFKSSASSGTAKQIGELLESIHEFTVTIMAKGNLGDLDTSFDSSLDEQMKIAAKQKLNAKQAELEAELKAKLQNKLDESTGGYGEDVQALLKGGESLEAKQKELEEMAKAKLTSWEEQQKAELEAKKAEEKARLEERKRKEKEAAKKKAQDAVKDKLKGLGF
jgi:uncharacterized protein (TIGR03545 family)